MQWLAEICIKRPIFALMLVLSVTVAGAFSFFSLGVDLYPNVDVPIVSVTVINAGAAPQEIETEIMERLEAEINTISGIKTLRSTAYEGIAQLEIEFILEKNGDTAAQEVRDKVNLVQSDLPKTAEAPIIQKFDANAAPILQIAVSAPRSLKELYEIADKQIAERVEGVAGVGRVEIIGGAKREIQVVVSPEKMQAYGIAANDVTTAIERQNQTLPGGRLDQGAQETSVRTIGKIARPADFEEIAVAVRNDFPIKLRDIAAVRDTTAELRTLSNLNGTPAVTLLIRKQSGKNTLAVADGVKEKLAEISANLPADVEMKTVDDATLPIRAAVGAVEEHLIEGSILACIIVFIFLWNWRLTIISALAIPTSIIGTFAMMAALGYTLDTITLLALTLMVGIVIDDAIIVLENIYHLIEKGVPPFEAAVEGTREVGLAVLATTLSLLAVFIPVGFMGGIVGRFMSSFGLTSAAAIAISLFVSSTLTPMLCARFIKAKTRKHHDGQIDSDNPKSKIQNPKSKGFFAPIDRAYTWMLHLTLRFRWAIIGLSIIVLFSNVLLFSLIGTDFVPQDDDSRFEIVLRAPEGASLMATATIVERIARDLRAEMPEITDTLTTIGSVEAGTVNNGRIFVKLQNIADRDEAQSGIINRTREILKKYPAELRLQARPVGQFGGGAAIQYLITGRELDKLRTYSEQFIEQIRREVPEAIDVDSNLNAGKPELRVVIDRTRAASLGIAVEDITSALNILVAGAEASTFNSGSDQFDVRIRAAGNFRQKATDLSKISVRAENGAPITLDGLVTFEPGAAASDINRYNRQRQVTISANVRQGSSVSAVTAKIEEIFSRLQFENGYRSELTGDAKEISNSLYYFALAFALSFVFMYMVLAAQFESFVHPITILLTLPLAIPFGVFCLLITGQNMNIFVGLGFLVLFGIVKKNAILQIDHTNGLRAKGMERDAAIIQANRDRLRPILMTTLAFVAGMIPLLISTGAGAATNRSIGTLVAGGQTLCLLLTLLAVPAFYSLFDDLGTHSVWRKIAVFWRILTRRFKRKLAAAMTIVIVICDAPAIYSQTETSAKLIENKAETKARRLNIAVDNPLSLTVQETIRLALENNNDLKVVETNVRIAEFELQSARGVFDPVVVGESLSERAVRPTASSLESASGSVKQTTFSNNLGVRGFAPRFGGNYSAEFNSGRSQTNAAFAGLNPQFPSSFTATFTQPLWRGLKTDENRRRIEIAKKNVSLSDAQFRRRAIEIISAVETAYWDLVFALKNLQVQQDAVQAAEAQTESNRRQVEQGVLAPIDIVQAEAQTANFKQNLYSAEETAAAAENNLKALILATRNDPRWTQALIPVSQPELSAPHIPLDEAVKTALENRPEFEQLRISREINEINSKFARDATKPRIDLTASYTSSGLAGKAETSNGAGIFGGDEALRLRVNELSNLLKLPPLTEIPPPSVPRNLIGGYGQSLSNLFGNRFPAYQIGVRFEIPIGNRAAKAELGRTLAEETRLDYERRNVEQQIQAQIRTAVQAVASSQNRLQAAAEARVAAEKQYDGERRQLLNGVSTTFLVLERQTALVTAQGREVEAQTNLSKTIANLNFAIGKALENNQIGLLSQSLERD